MNRKSVRFISNVLVNLFASFPIVVGSTIDFASAEVTGLEVQSPHERDIFNTSPGSGQPNVFEVTNPMQLMNQLRRMTAMDDATSPSEAVDAALDALELDQ